MRNYFIKLFDFNYWANNIIIDFLNQNKIADQKILNIMSHIAHAQHNWYFRVVNQQQDIPVWSIISMEKLTSTLAANGGLWNEFVKGLNEEILAKPLEYRNMQGDPYLNALEDVLAHVVNHSTYHRGQVIFLIREAGIVPPSTDYIRFARSLKS